MYALGIDLGTTFTAAAVWRDGRAEISPLGSRAAAIPSVVVLREDETIITGESANRRALSTPHRVAREFKRRLGDTTPILLAGAPYSAESLMAKLLRAVVEQVSAREGGPPDAVCVSHPANWGPYKTELLQQAVRGADLEHITFTTEPVAAAVAYAHQERLPEGAVVAVYDLGGGTFDAAVLRSGAAGFEILGRPEGIERLGGIDIDAAVFAHVARSLNGALDDLDDEDAATIAAVARLKEECTQAKEALSADTDTTIPVLLPKLTTEVRLTRAELETMVRPALQDTIDALRRALRSAGVGPEDLHSVLLVGGSSRMPIVAQLVGAELGRPVAIDIHPKHAVALGAAWLAGEQVAPTEAAPAEPASAVETMLLPSAAEGLADPPAVMPLLPAPPSVSDPAPDPGLVPVAGPPAGRFPFPGLPESSGEQGSTRRGFGFRAGRTAALGLAAVIVIATAVVVVLKQHHGSSPAAGRPPASVASPSPSAGSGAAADVPVPIVVVAHRAGFEKFPHESLPAVRDAAQAGDVVQVDVQWTSDDVPILIHERTTVAPAQADSDTPMVCTGGPYVIADTKWSVLQAKCRSLASASTDGKRYPIVDLDDAMKAVAAVPGARFFPEVTAKSPTRAQTADLIELIAKYDLAKRTMVGSFSPTALEQVRKQAITAGVDLQLMRYILPAGDGSVPSAGELSTEHLYAVTVRSNVATAAYVSALKAKGLVVMAWAPNTETEWEAAKKAGVSTVFTDKPAAYRTWLGK